MKRIIILAILALLAFALTASAQADLPDGVQVFYLEGRVCVLWPDGSGDCYCPCEPCAVVLSATPREPSAMPREPEPTATPIPQDTPVPAARCNRGIGNLDEGCDPGNSSGQGQGEGRRAGEDRDEPTGP